MMPANEAHSFIQGIADALNTPDRALPGGYLYLSDLLSDPVMTRRMGTIMAQPCFDLTWVLCSPWKQRASRLP